jgi:hypothetical protein
VHIPAVPIGLWWVRTGGRTCVTGILPCQAKQVPDDSEEFPPGPGNRRLIRRRGGGPAKRPGDERLRDAVGLLGPGRETNRFATLRGPADGLVGGTAPRGDWSSTLLRGPITGQGHLSDAVLTAINRPQARYARRGAVAACFQMILCESPGVLSGPWFYNRLVSPRRELLRAFDFNAGADAHLRAFASPWVVLAASLAVRPG